MHLNLRIIKVKFKFFHYLTRFDNITSNEYCPNLFCRLEELHRCVQMLFSPTKFLQVFRRLFQKIVCFKFIIVFHETFRQHQLFGSLDHPQRLVSNVFGFDYQVRVHLGELGTFVLRIS